MFNNHDPNVQGTMYGAGLFASHAGWQHTICLLIEGLLSSSVGYISNLSCIVIGDILGIWH